MHKSKGYSKLWFLVLLLVTFVAGCGAEGGSSLSQSSEKSVTAFSLAGVAGTATTGTIDEAAKTIAVNMPFGTDARGLVATFAISGGSAKVAGVDQTSGSTANDFTTPVAYTVTASDGTTAVYTATVAVAAVSAKAVTGYSVAGVPGAIDETAKTISVTLPSGTSLTALVATFATSGAGVKVAGALQTSGTTANDFTAPLIYTVTAADASSASYTVTVTAALASAKAITGYALAGVIGTINETAKTIALTLPNGTNLTALVATFATTGGSVKVATVLQKSGTTANDFTTPLTYTVTAADATTAAYTVTVTVAANSSKAMSAFSLAAVAGVIDETAKTISVTMPTGTDVTALVATFTSTGASVKVATALQTSRTTANNFATPVLYAVIAADGTTATYTVTVTVAANSAKAVTAFSLAGVAGTINETTKTVSVAMPRGSNVAASVAAFTSTGVSVKVAGTVQTSGITPNNFTNPVVYTVTAANDTTATYTVTVTTPLGPAPVLLGAAGNYVILAESGVSTVPGSLVTGDVGLSPAAASFLTGFSLTKVGTTSAISTQVVGSLFAADMTAPTSSNLTTAITNMGTAYTDAAGRPTPDFLNLGVGEIGGKTLVPGLYKWTTGVTISSDVVLSGGANDVWIFQIPGNLTMSAAKNVTLSGGALARNIFWQVAGAAAVGTTSHFEGVILSQTSITLGTGASMNGRALAQTAVILNSNAVTKPN